MLMGNVLGIDIGGTNVKAGLLSEEGVLEAKLQVPSGDLVDGSI